ncbi:uncharacterized protein LOC135288083 [Passer domesticus]|uniref:uncharacterized protein LOC135288083 n=1 Tax=Passer domesticus TaxID=48849 RepID=UPI0030FEB129
MPDALSPHPRSASPLPPAKEALGTPGRPRQRLGPATTPCSGRREPLRTNNPSCRLRSRRTAKAWTLRDSVYRRLSQNLLLPIKPQPPGGTRSLAGGSPHSPHVITLSCQAEHPLTPETHRALLLPASRQAAAGPARAGRGVAGGLTLCHHGGPTGDTAHRPAAGWAPPRAAPTPPAARSGAIPVCRARVPHPPRACPASPPRVSRVPPRASRAALTCPRSAQAEPPPLPLPPGSLLHLCTILVTVCFEAEGGEEGGGGARGKDVPLPPPPPPPLRPPPPIPAPRGGSERRGGRGGGGSLRSPHPEQRRAERGSAPPQGRPGKEVVVGGGGGCYRK